ncbi:MAG TPA: efflux RND transporter periplasmic adaptor subunit [Longimicrobiales bacterium]
MRKASMGKADRAMRAIGAVALLALAACGRGEGAAPAAAAAPMTVGPENIVIARAGTVHTGPSLSGNLKAERQATVRAEVGGAVLQTFADKGQRVQAGQLLARIDDTALRDQYLSARSAVTTASEAAAVAQRNLERSQRLVTAGALADRDLETAKLSASSAQSQLQDARSRLVQAQKQLDKTAIRAPLAGVISDRPVSSGDIVQAGNPLFTVVDPSSMRLDAAVPADQLGSVHVGAPVFFTVTGYPGRSFQGHVERINPAADPATGQVPVYISIPNAAGTLVGGLYAQGRVASETRQGIIVPVAAVQDNGSAPPTVMRIRLGRVESVAVQIGIRDEQAETVELTAGLTPGDTLLVGTAQGISPGTTVRVQALKEGPA